MFYTLKMIDGYCTVDLLRPKTVTSHEYVSNNNLSDFPKTK